MTFFTYGCMMTCAALADSLLPASWLHSKNPWHMVVMIVDVWLTSSIATSFMFNGFGIALVS